MKPEQAGQEPARTPVHILSVPKSGYAIIAFAGPYRGILMHWKGASSVPCLGPDDCPAALHKSGTTWKGYAPVRQWDHNLGVWIPWALEITEALEELLRGRDLRGEVWRLSRTRKKKKPGAVQGALEEVRTDPALLVTFDVRPVVQRRFHCQELTWDVPNPIKPKLTVELTTAAPPASIPLSDPYGSAKIGAAKGPTQPVMNLAERFKRFPASGEKQAAAHDKNGTAE